MSIFLNYWNTSFRWVPEGSIDLNELISSAVVLPPSNPLLQHLSGFSISDGHFLNAEDLQWWRMEHFLHSATSWLKHSQCNHVLQPQVFVIEREWLNWVSVKCWEGRRLREQLLFRGVLKILTERVKLWHWIKISQITSPWFILLYIVAGRVNIIGVVLLYLGQGSLHLVLPIWLYMKWL